MPDSLFDQTDNNAGFCPLEKALRVCRGSIAVEVIDHRYNDKFQKSNLDVLVIWFSSGFDLQGHTIAKLQSRTNKPFIVYLSKYDEVSELVSLRSGAFDVLHSEMSCNVIAERIMAVTRRNSDCGIAHSDFDDKQRKINSSGCWLDIQANEFWFNGKTTEFTTTEIKLLEALISKDGAIVTRSELLSAIEVIGEETVSLRTVDSHIKRIRQKIKAKYANLTLIKSVYGQGYKVIVPVSLLSSRAIG